MNDSSVHMNAVTVMKKGGSENGHEIFQDIR
jgi:hypothetical protein